MTAQLYSPSALIMLDPDKNRLEVSRSLGATATVSARGVDAAVEAVRALTKGNGVDVAIEAVGVPESFEVCQGIVAAGGHVANVGVHGKPVELHLERLWAHNVTITTRLVDTATTPMLLKLVLSGRLQAKKLVTHRFAMAEIMKAYDTFADAANTKALKVAIAAGTEGRR
jgi:alcohol dehydrogenase